MRWPLGLIAALVLISPAFAQTPPSSPESMPLAVIDHLRTAVEDEIIAGCSVLIAVDGNVVVRTGFGYADIKLKQQFTPELLCPVSSITKILTSLTLMRLEEQGVLTLDTPIAEIAPEFKGIVRDTGEAPFEPIRVRHLLAHSSGIPGQGYLTRNQMVFLNDPRASLAETATRVALFPLISEPGEAFEYSGAGYLVAGYAAERGARSPFDVLVREKVLRPLGMARTTFMPNDIERRFSPRRYRATDDGFSPYPRNFRGPFRLVDSGDGLYSTADDLARLGNYLLDPGSRPELLSQGLIAEFDRRQSGGPSRTAEGYGLGVQRDRQDARGRLRAFHHTGSGGQYLWVDRDRRVVGVFLTNANPADAVPVAEGMRAIVERFIAMPSTLQDSDTSSD